MAAALQVAPGQILIDLACGRGGYGREIARRTGARLAGPDFSAVAVTIAAHGRPRDRARFCAGDFTASAGSLRRQAPRPGHGHRPAEPA